MSAAPIAVRLEDGRILRASEGGDPRGRPVFVLHASPGSKLLYGIHEADASRRGVRLIGHDRPGYGGSTAKAGRFVVDEASDVRAIADHLGIDRFAVWGHSSGGSFALACAATLPKRAVAVASLAGVAPYPADGLDWFAGVDPSVVADFQLYSKDPVAWRLKLTSDVEEMRSMPEAKMYESLSSYASASDRSVLSKEFLAFAHAQTQDGLSPGPDGFIEDHLAGISPWGFDLGSVRVPVQLWHGMDDPIVPLSHAKWLADHLPHAETHVEPGEGHMSLFARRIPEVHEWLLAQF